MAKLIFCYWDLRGFGAPAVNMLEYGGMEYEHKLATGTWFEEKYKLGFDFPNLPYLIDGDVRLTESWAIYKYLGKKLGLAPSGCEEERQSDVLQGVIQDTRTNFTRNCYSPDTYKNAEKMLSEQVKRFDMLDKYLQSRKFLLGDKLTYLDFVLFETLDHHRLFFGGDVFSKHANVESYVKRFETMDKMAAFFKSDRYRQFPINGSMATWGGQKHNDKK